MLIHDRFESLKGKIYTIEGIIGGRSIEFYLNKI